MKKTTFLNCDMTECITFHNHKEINDLQICEHIIREKY